MKTGVVILNYNVADAVITLANRFLLFFDVDNIVIVDNASKESDREKITEYYSNQKNSKLKFIQSSVNGGYARGNNIGLRWLVEKCECDICFISNPDIDIKQEDFTKIISAFRHSNTFSVLTCKREYSNGQSIRQHWQLAAYKTLIMECFYIYRCFEKKNYIYDVDTRYPVISIEVAPGAFWAIRSETLRKVNYLDEGTFLYYEEMCFGKKINLIGEKEGLVTDASYTVHKGIFIC